MMDLKDLEAMKDKPINPFGNQYDFFFMNLENNYIKSNINQIKSELNNWGTEARVFIINELTKILIDDGVSLDSDELFELNKLKEE